MFAIPVKSGDKQDPLPTQPAVPSVADPTRTGEPVSTPGPAPGTTDSRSVGSLRLRDRERYQIIGEHGRGGIGRVFRAYDHDLGRDIAIKEITSRGTVSEVRFMREALITARLEHPGIVPIYEAGRWSDGTPFYAMKLVSGRPLRDLIAERTTVEDRLGLLHHVLAVADAIAYAHGRNIIHRDLKPANVIVGDFGETIVIDWGLAKDLSVPDDVAIGGGPFRTHHDDGLTAAGSVLGTPSYMAPEQERGEHVDQRADVFAIGAMLWELCTLQKVPLGDVHLRHRLLRRAGIDRDLTSIVDKALEPDPARRYPDAGSLAADLKAFRSGARIAARSYSPLAMLGHWMRRHRAVAVSAIVAIVVAVSGSVLYVRNIAVERDRAEAYSNRLVLEHAEGLLRSDPTAASELLQTYTGTDRHRLAMLRAEAQGLGLSHLAIRPHLQAIFFAHALSDGSLVTLGADGAVVTTSAAGISRNIARDGTQQLALQAFAYSDTHHLLAYACTTSAICLVDVEAGTTRSPPESSFAPVGLAFSPSGDLLVAVSAHGNTSVWHLPQNGAPRVKYQATFEKSITPKSIAFIDEHTIAARTSGHVEIIRLDTSEQSRPEVHDIAVRDTSTIDASNDLQWIAVGTASGTVVIVDATSRQIVHQEAVCKGHVNRLRISSPRSAVAYACQDGDVGIWDPARNKPSVLAHTDGGAAVVAVSADGRYLVAGANNGRLLAVDLTTQRLNWYLGHATRITEVQPPSSSYPYIVAGDTMGAVRTWAPPDASFRVAIKTSAALSMALLLPNRGPVVAVGGGTTIPWYDRDGASGELPGHDPSHGVAASSTTQARFALYGVDDEVELWSFEPRSINRTLKTGRGAVTAVAWASDDTRLVTGGADGVITEWSSEDDSHHDLGEIHESIAFMRAVPHTDTIVVASASGKLWLHNKMGLRFLDQQTDPVYAAVCSPDSRWLAIGTSHGIVQLYDIVTRESFTVFADRSWIDFLMFSPDSKQLAISTADEVILKPVATPDDYRTREVPENSDTRWYRVKLPVRHMAFSPDGRWFAATGENGRVWFYRRADNHWIHLSVGTARVSFGKFSEDSAYFAASDPSGRALLVDMHAKIFD
jgi:WD40 repeat protein